MGCVMDTFDEASEDIKTEHTVRKLGDPRVVVEDCKIKLLSGKRQRLKEMLISSPRGRSEKISHLDFSATAANSRHTADASTSVFSNYNRIWVNLLYRN